MEHVGILKSAFETVQAMVAEGVILAAHDVSDGGLIVSLLEMAFSGDCGLQIDVSIPPTLHPGVFECPRSHS